MKFSELFGKKTETRDLQATPDSLAASLIFGSYRLDESATTLSAFFAATELISNSVAQLPISVKRETGIDKNHPINLLFKNGLITKFNLMKNLVTDIIMYGNAYCYIEKADDGTPLSLTYLERGDVTVYYNKNTQDLYYQVVNHKPGRVRPENMIHLYKNSINGVQGKSLVSYANQVLQLAKATDKTASKYYSSGCALSGVLTIKGARKGAKEAARDAFATTHSGSSGSGLVILDEDMSYTPISGSASDSQMLEARAFNVEEIARYFNINPLLLGDTKGASYKSIEEANVEFLSRTLMPYVSLIEDEFNRKLVKPEEQGKVIIDFEEGELLRGDMKSTSEYIQKLVSSGIMTTNEAREMLGLPAKEGCDELIVAYTKISDNKVSGEEEKEPETKIDEENGKQRTEVSND